MLPNPKQPTPSNSNFINDSEPNFALDLGCDAIAIAALLTDWNQRNEAFYGPSLSYQEQ